MEVATVFLQVDGVGVSSEVYSHQIQVKSQVNKIRHARLASERVGYEASRTTGDVTKLSHRMSMPSKLIN